MKKCIALGVILVMCSVQVHCVPPLGRRVLAPADGRFSQTEVDRLRKCKEAGLTKYGMDDTYKIVLAYANDMRVFIRKYVWKEWPGIDRMYLYLAPTRKKLLDAWWHCTVLKRQEPGKKMVGFYCPYNGEITVLKRKKLPAVIEVFDHEEGHYINNLNGDVAEFPSEFNSRWKAFLRFALDTDVGLWFSDYISLFGPQGLYKDNDTIEKMGKYQAAALMFFFVANHYNGDLTKAAKFVLLSGDKTLRKFFYTKLRAYKNTGLTMGEVWEKEVLNLWNGIGLQKYLQSIRERIKKDKRT